METGFFILKTWNRDFSWNYYDINEQSLLIRVDELWKNNWILEKYVSKKTKFVLIWFSMTADQLSWFQYGKRAVTVNLVSARETRRVLARPDQLTSNLSQPPKLPGEDSAPVTTPNERDSTRQGRDYRIRITLRREEHFHSTSHKQQLYESLSKQEDLCSTSYYSLELEEKARRVTNNRSTSPS